MLAGNLNYLSPDNGNTAIAIDFNQGGVGGTGGIGGAVSVSNGAIDDDSARILTTGINSHGIHAQSIGGGGGNGGSNLSGNFANSSSAYQLAINIGGQGGSGGHGGLVTVDNFGSIETRGDDAHGIFAQSIGGGGGNGGLSLAVGNLYASRAFPRQALIAIGGAGGMGNDAGDVIVNNSGLIITAGEDANGIFAQSLGGGGGNMSVGISLIFDPRINAAVNFLSNAIGFGLGAQEGTGGQGGMVTVNHTGDIIVSGDGARGVVAESINGGGGGLTLDFSGIAGFASGDLLPGAFDIEPVSELPSLTLFGGAAGTGDSNAERVTVNLDGDVMVLGNNGAGIFQQAVGGGGGTIDLGLNFTEEDVDNSDPLGLEIALGGSDGDNNNGGELSSTHVGNIITAGVSTSALFLQSIGGGGGRANIDLSGPEQRLGEVALSLGGSALTDSVGGLIAHTQTGSISTIGDGAIGGVIQSIGGGGGLINLRYSEAVAPTSTSVATEATSALVQRESVVTSSATTVVADGALSLGADGGSALNGGAIDFAMNGNIATEGENASGLLLQSIGAGGGQANLAGIDGLSLTLGGTGSAQGNGGDIIFTNNGSVMTTGAQSHSLVIQSIGGGGGAIFGDLEGSTVDVSADNIGSGGSIVVTQNGDIITLGEDAFGIIAQSLGGGGGFVDGLFAGTAGGSGSGSAITLNITGDVMTLGDGSTAIFAQSLGSDGGGDIALDLAIDQMIIAGLDGTAIAFDGGADNVFNNNGTVMTLDGLDGMVMTGTSGNDVINNAGLILGNVALGGGINALNNLADGQFISVSTLDLGESSNLFTNSGFLASGDLGVIQQTALGGSFVQTDVGSTFAEADLATETFDAINATGTVAVSGNVDLSLQNTSQFTPGMFSALIFTGDQGASMNNVNLRADSSVVLNLLGISATGNAVQVDYDLTFAPEQAIGNRALVGDYLNRVQTAGVSTVLQPTFDFLIGIQDVDQYVDLLTQLGSEFYAEQNAHALRGAQSFNNRMINCGSTFDRRIDDKGDACAWAEFNIDDGTLDANLGTPSISSDSINFSAGAHYQLGGGLSVAVSVGYDDYDLAGFGNLWTAQGDAQRVGLGAAYNFGETSIGLYASVGSASYKTTRTLPGFGGSVATGNRKLLSVTGEVVASHNFRFSKFTATPNLNLGVTRLSRGGSVENGAAPNDLNVEWTSGSHAWAMPGIQLSYDAPISSSWNLRPFANGALRQYLTSPFAEVSASFGADTSGVTPFLSGTPLDRSHFIGEAGIEFYSNSGISISGSYSLEKSSNRDSNTGAIRLVVPF